MEKTIPEIYSSEFQLMEFIWQEGSVPMKQLLSDALEYVGWQRTTVYTMVKRLSERGALVFEDGVVTALVTREQVQFDKAKSFVEEYFDGKLSNMVALYAAKKKIRKDDAAAIRETMKNYSK